MASNDVEVEIKIQLDTATFSQIKERLKQLATFVKASQEVDDYYTPAHRDFLAPEFPFEWLRIRNKAGKTILNYKHWHPENTPHTTHCDEFETEVAKPEQLHKIFSALELKKMITVDKIRETYHYKDEFEIALDTVKELGHYIEIEALKDFGGIETTREKLLAFAQQLGIDASQVDKRGYPFILMEKKGLLKR